MLLYSLLFCVFEFAFMQLYFTSDSVQHQTAQDTLQCYGFGLLGSSLFLYLDFVVKCIQVFFIALLPSLHAQNSGTHILHFGCVLASCFDGLASLMVYFVKDQVRMKI